MADASFNRSELPQPTSPPVESTTIDLEGEPSHDIGRARIGLWHGARASGETGVEAAEGCLSFSVFEIPAVPDFSSPRFPDLAQLDKAQRTARVAQRQKQFLDALHTLGPNVAVSLRYFYRQPADGEGRIRLFLIGRSYGLSEPDATRGIRRFRELVNRTFPDEYRLIDFQASSEDALIAKKVLSLEGVSSIAEILKPEQALAAWHDPALCGFSFYYFPKSFEPADGDMVEFCRALVNDRHGRDLVVDMCLIPTAQGSPVGPLTETERVELNAWINVCERWGRDQRQQVPGGLYSKPTHVEIEADPQAQEARKAYAELLQRYGNPQARLFLYSFRVLWWEDEPPIEAASALTSFANAPGTAPHPCALDKNHPAFGRALNAARLCYVTPAVCRDLIWQRPDAPETLRRLHRLVDVKEAAGFFRLPIPGREGCPGIPHDMGFISQRGEEVRARDNLKVGRYVEGIRETASEASFKPGDLAKHCLIVGTPGSGKTTLCFSLLKQLWEEQQIPFIVLEPAKTEYRALKELPCFREDLLIFSVGNENISPFRFNPFEVSQGISVSEHISTLNTCFSGAFSLWDPLPMILDQSIREIYEDKGWYESDLGGEDPALMPPTMEDLFEKALAIAQGTSYRGETAGNIRGALETRLGSLVRGFKGRCFNTRRSIPLNILMERPIVLELDALDDQEKALMMMFMLTLVREHAKSHQRQRRLSGRELNHVVLVEEAHNVIGRGDAAGGGAEKAHPKEVSIRFFTRMLAEVRAWNEGIIIADQLPTAIAPEAIKNTNLKVMHRLVAADDRRELGEAMVFDAGQFTQAATLPVGQSLFFKEGEARSRLVVEPNFKKQCEDAGYEVNVPPDDETVRVWMKSFREEGDAREIYLPYTDCAKICRTCNSRVRQESERLVERQWSKIESIAAQIIKSQPQLSDPYPAILHQLGGTQDDPLRCGCLRIHAWRQIGKQSRENL